MFKLKSPIQINICSYTWKSSFCDHVLLLTVRALYFGETSNRCILYVLNSSWISIPWCRKHVLFLPGFSFGVLLWFQKRVAFRSKCLSTRCINPGLCTICDPESRCFWHDGIPRGYMMPKTGGFPFIVYPVLGFYPGICVLRSLKVLVFCYHVASAVTIAVQKPFEFLQSMYPIYVSFTFLVSFCYCLSRPMYVCKLLFCLVILLGDWLVNRTLVSIHYRVHRHTSV